MKVSLIPEFLNPAEVFMGYWGGYPPYVSVAEKKAKAARKLKKLKKINPDIQPIVVEGRTLARTWWGKSWNKNLERYADYSNRIGRGRSYVRHGAVLDLQIHSGEIRALVQGTGSRPYSVTIEIQEIDRDIWKSIKTECEGKLDSLSELLMGKFPKVLGEIFTAMGKGLFPSPREIRFSCSCPDWAYMCKHVAATLYGVGTRLDEDPGLFFKLRKVNVDDLISQAVENKTQKLLKKAETKSSRVIDDSDLSDIFGIDMDMPASEEKNTRETSKKPAVKEYPVTPPAKQKPAVKEEPEPFKEKPAKAMPVTKPAKAEIVINATVTISFKSG